MVSLVISLLETDGKIDVQQAIGRYVPHLSDTAWAGIKVIDVLNMASGLDVIESEEKRRDPASMFGRFVRVIFKQPGPAGCVEKHDEVIRSGRKLREPGKTFEYSSLNTQVLVRLAEAVEHRPWADIFRDRVWSKMYSEGELQISLTPDGVALGCGLVSIRLRDLARFGMLYTPSWTQAGRERIVTIEMEKKIQTGVSSERKVPTPKGDRPATNSRQWDWVFPDGDFFKGGMHGQGLYVSPKRDLVIAWFSTTASTALPNYARHIANMYDQESLTQPTASRATPD
jgi:CubicO group peptidase (beta-lactamase class C family)